MVSWVELPAEVVLDPSSSGGRRGGEGTVSGVGRVGLFAGAPLDPSLAVVRLVEGRGGGMVSVIVLLKLPD